MQLGILYEGEFPYADFVMDSSWLCGFESDFSVSCALYITLFTTDIGPQISLM